MGVLLNERTNFDNLRGGFKGLENHVNTHKKLALQFFVRNNVQLTKSFPEFLVATERQKYRMTSTGECLVQQQSLYTSGCPVQVINDSGLSEPVSGLQDGPQKGPT